MPTALWAVREGLRSVIGAVVDVPVIDGPVAQTTPPGTYVLIGTDGGDLGTGETNASGTRARQQFANLGGSQRHEEGEVIVSVWSWSGSTDMAVVRAVVTAIVDDITDAVLADKYLDGALTRPGWCEITAIEGRESQTQSGALFRAVITAAYTSRLT